MRRYVLQQNHLMENVGFILLFVFISLGTIGGCNNNGDGNNTQALTENDFAADPSLRANPEGGVTVMFLEHPESDVPPNDTAEIGRDTIPVRYRSTIEHRFCWEDNDDEAGHFMTIEDEEGNVILKVDANGECDLAVIEMGNYFMHLHHDGKEELSHPIFLIPGGNEELAFGDNETHLDGIIVKVSELLSRLDLGLTQISRAQTVAQNIQTLLRTRSCEGCDLKGANLGGVSLMGVRLAGADLSGAFFSGSDLSCLDSNNDQTCSRFDNVTAVSTNFGCTDPNDLATCVNLNNAVFAQADLRNADLNGADLSKAFFNGSNMTGVNLMGSWLTSTSFSFANLTDANLLDVGLEFTEFFSATWCDGTCICNNNVLDSCGGCAPIDTCTGK